MLDAKNLANNVNQKSDYSLEAICIYPVKGMAGISLQNSNLQNEGLEYDRRLMLVNKQGKFLSQREFSQLSLFRCSIQNDILEVSYQAEKISLPISEKSKELIDVSVWESKFKAAKSKMSINEWFSDQLGMSVQLVSLSEKSRRNKYFQVPPFKSQVSFADGYPVLIVGTASMELLNSKLEKPVGYNRFRPNLVVKTNIPHEEDSWHSLRIGNSEMKIIKPCVRCMVPTIDQLTGIKGKEPMKTLSKYRAQDKKVMFGANTITSREGSFTIEDKIHLI